MKFKHLDEIDRKKISSGLVHNLKCKEIAEILNCDPTTVSKEIKQHRIISKKSKYNPDIMCKKLDRFPYVCKNCPHKYTDCKMTKLSYDARIANATSERVLRNSRVGINLAEDEAIKLEELLKTGLKENKSVYEIVQKSGIDISVPTVYRNIKLQLINVKSSDLPYAVQYKKRKRKKYEYPQNNQINRENRSYIDYLAYKHKNINLYACQLGFLGSIKSDSSLF